VLLDLLGRARGNTRDLAIVHDVQDEVRRRIGREPNVDLALAAMTVAAGMPPDGGEVTMAVARTAGWLAHAIEEYSESPLRFRPRASYVGS
jgi:citrate synthase